jgi:hypothetical protein
VPHRVASRVSGCGLTLVVASSCGRVSPDEGRRCLQRHRCPRRSAPARACRHDGPPHDARHRALRLRAVFRQSRPGGLRRTGLGRGRDYRSGDRVAERPVADAPAAFVRNRYQTRLCWLPSELTKYLRAKAESKFKDGRCVIIPVGKLEDFEDLPVSVASMKPRVDLHRVAWSSTLPRGTA